MELTYKIKRSPKRKNLTITVERDRSIVVHAPESASEEKDQSYCGIETAMDLRKDK